MKFEKEINPNQFVLKGTFLLNDLALKEKESFIFEDLSTKVAYIYLGKPEEYNYLKLVKIVEFIFENAKRNYQIDINTFVNNNINEKTIINVFIEVNEKFNGKNLNLKSTAKKSKNIFTLITSFNKLEFEKEIFLASQMSNIRYLQDLPNNILSIDKMCKTIVNEISINPKINTKILTGQELLKLNMNLILGVNKGSKQKVKVLVLSYLPNKNSKDKITLIGKGIIFDSGGYNLKRPAKYMLNMKYDMSGAAICAYIIDTIAKMGINKNVCAVLPLTDNLVDSKAQLPESIYTSMSGKSVEIANTDAEGRLILADAITYAAKELKSSLIIDIATLTGAILYGLGSKYSGCWATNDQYWKRIEYSSSLCNEFVWRMPLDKDFLSSLKVNTFADYLSCSFSEHADSNVAAAWLNEFALNVPYIHFDIAGTGEINGKGQAPLFKTLVNFIENLDNPIDKNFNN